MFVGGNAHAHVQPAMDRNNRYIKLSLHRDRLRLVYTIYFGEVPGAAARRAMDANRNQTIESDESAPVGKRLGEALLPSLELQIDDGLAAIAWSHIDVGLGTATTAAGAFSVDLVAWLCLPAAGLGRHRVTLRDNYELPMPGETELKAEPDFGIVVERMTVGGDPAEGDWLKVRGADALADGWIVDYTVGDKAPRIAGSCPSASALKTRSTASWGVIAVGAFALLAALAALGLSLRRAANPKARSRTSA